MWFDVVNSVASLGTRLTYHILIIQDLICDVTFHSHQNHLIDIQTDAQLYLQIQT